MCRHEDAPSAHRAIHGVLSLAVLAAACSQSAPSDGSAPSLTSRETSTSPSAQGLTSHPTDGSSQGWSPDLEEQAAAILADGIKRKYPLETRMAAGRCAIAKLKKYYETFDDWRADHNHPESLDVLSRELNALGECERKVGI